MAERRLHVIVVSLLPNDEVSNSRSNVRATDRSQVGGSFSGLFAALALRKLGHSVQVLERSTTEELKGQGAGLRVGDDVQEFLHEHAHEWHPPDNVVTELVALDRAGNQVNRIPRITARVTNWSTLYHALRASFDGENGLSDGDAKYNEGCQVVSLREDGDGILVEYLFEDQSHKSRVDVVIAADGASSTVRRLLLPEVNRTYAGYVIWRGLVPEQDVNRQTHADLVGRYCNYFGDDHSVLVFTLPGEEKNAEVGEQLMNWAWYRLHNETKLDEIMIDVNGTHHRHTVPIGYMRPDVSQWIKATANDSLPPQFADVIENTKNPFVQAITDVFATKNAFWNGKVLLLGEAACGPRPHIAASTSQAAFHATKLKQYLEGKMSLDQWSRQTMAYSQELYQAGIKLGHNAMSTEVAAKDKGARSAAITTATYKTLKEYQTA